MCLTVKLCELRGLTLLNTGEANQAGLVNFFIEGMPFLSDN